MQCAQCHIPMTLLADLPSVRGFEFTLFECPKCEQRVMGCFCVASGITGTEAVTAEDVAIIMKSDRLRLQEFMKTYHARVIGD